MSEWTKGVSVKCKFCGKRKQPTGRCASMEMANGLCNMECPGYYDRPNVGDLWPGELRHEFGYPEKCPMCELPTELLGIHDPAAAIKAAREALEALIKDSDRQCWDCGKCPPCQGLAALELLGMEES